MENPGVYDRIALRDALERCIKAEPFTIVESLESLIQTIADTAYKAGRRSVQQEIIKTLDLRFLLGD